VSKPPRPSDSAGQESITANTSGLVAGDAVTVLTSMDQSKVLQAALVIEKQKAAGFFPASEFAEAF